MFVALGRVGCSSAVAGATTNAGIEAIVIWFAAIAAFANDIIVALALAHEGVTLQSAQLVAVAALAVLQLHCIAIEARCAQVTGHARGIVQTTQTFACACVAGAWLIRIYIAGAFAGLAHITRRLGRAIEAIGTALTACTGVPGQALAVDLLARLRDLASGGKVVRVEGQWTGADHAVVRRPIGGIAIISRQTLLAVVATRRVLAVLADASGTVAGIGMAVALAGHAVAAIWPVLHTMIARGAVFARVSHIAGRALAVLHGQELIFARAVGILVGQRQIDIGELRIQGLLPVVSAYEDHSEITQGHHEVGAVDRLPSQRLEIRLHHLQTILEGQIAARLLVALVHKHMILAEQNHIRRHNGLAHKARCEVQCIGQIATICRYMAVLIEQIVQDAEVGNALIARIPVGEVRLQCGLVEHKLLLGHIPYLELDAIFAEVDRVDRSLAHQADVVDAQIGAGAARGLAKAEAGGAAIGIARLQIVRAVHALITVASDHILLAEAAAVDLVAHLQLRARRMAAALAAARELVIAIGTAVAGASNDVLAALTGAVEHVALLVAIRNAHVVAAAALAANHLVEAIGILRAPAMS